MAKYSLNPFTVKQYGSFRLHQNHQRNPSLTMIIVTSCLLVLLFLLFGYCLKQNLNAWIISSNVTNVITAETAAETTITTASLSSSSPEILNLPLKTFVPLELSSGGGRLLSSEHQNHHHEPHAEMKEDAVLDSDDLRTTTYNETAFDEDDDVDDDHRDDVGISHYDHHQDLDHQFDDVSLKKSSKNERFKRSVLGLASMIRCIARCNPLSYKNYGCFCGFQGEGRPVDPIDKCCYMHDLCYTRTDCNQVLVYFVSYKWLCHNNGRASCGYMVNGNSSEQCGYQLCECDRRFAKCLSRYRCPKGKPSCRTKRNTIMDFAKLFSI